MNSRQTATALFDLRFSFILFILLLMPFAAKAQREILQLSVLSGPVTFSVTGLGEEGSQIVRNAVSVQIESSADYELKVVSGTSVFLDGVSGQSLPPSAISVSLNGENSFIPISANPIRLTKGSRGTSVFNFDLSVQPVSQTTIPAGRYQGELIFQVVAL